jgi:hypothetical protein
MTMFGLRNDCNLLVTEKKRLHQGYCSIHYLEKNILKLYYPYKDFFYKYIETHKIRKKNLIRKWHIRHFRMEIIHGSQG